MVTKRAIFFLIACLFAACGQGRECTSVADCTDGQNGICISGACRYYPDDLLASIVVDISFPRQMTVVPASGKIWLFHSIAADGSTFDCEQAASATDTAGRPELNPLLAEPRYLVFNCCGTFYPDNLVQFVQPASSAVMLGEAYATRDAQGQRIAFGCVEELAIEPSSRLEATLSMKEE